MGCLAYDRLARLATYQGDGYPIPEGPEGRNGPEDVQLLRSSATQHQTLRTSSFFEAIYASSSPRICLSGMSVGQDCARIDRLWLKSVASSAGTSYETTRAFDSLSSLSSPPPCCTGCRVSGGWAKPYPGWRRDVGGASKGRIGSLSSVWRHFRSRCWPKKARVRVWVRSLQP